MFPTVVNNVIFTKAHAICQRPSSFFRPGMIEAALKLGEETRPRLAVKLKIGYTRQATRFRCSEVRTKSGVAVWKDYITGACTRGRPRYSFEEAGAARKVQAAWAGLQGRRAFRAQLAEQSVRSLSIACINEASSHAWIGHGEVHWVFKAH